MNAFWIYATILTIAYVIYYAVVYFRDKYGKKDEVTSDVESIDVPVSEESPTFIKEDNPMFESNETQEETQTLSQNQTQYDEESETGEGQTQQTDESPQEQEMDVTFYDPEHPEGISAKEKKRRAQLGFEDVDVESSHPMNEAEFKEQIKNCKPNNPTVRIKYDRI